MEMEAQRRPAGCRYLVARATAFRHGSRTCSPPFGRPPEQLTSHAPFLARPFPLCASSPRGFTALDVCACASPSPSRRALLNSSAPHPGLSPNRRARRTNQHKPPTPSPRHKRTPWRGWCRRRRRQWRSWSSRRRRQRWPRTTTVMPSTRASSSSKASGPAGCHRTSASGGGRTRPSTTAPRRGYGREPVSLSFSNPSHSRAHHPRIASVINTHACSAVHCRWT